MDLFQIIFGIFIIIAVYIRIRIERNERDSNMALLVFPLFEFKISYIDGKSKYSSCIVDKETYSIRQSTDVSFYSDAMNVIAKIEKNKIGIDDLLFLYPKPGESNDFATHPYALKYIPYDHALKLFAEFEHVKNEIGRLFIVLQFLIYFHNKKDKNIQEFIAFGEKVEADRSKIVRASGPILFRHFKTTSYISPEIDRIFFFFFKVLDGSNNDKSVNDFTSYRKFIANSNIDILKRKLEIQPSKIQRDSSILTRIKIIGYTLMADFCLRQDHLPTESPKIIGYTLMADTFLQQDLLHETRVEDWKELMVEMSSVLFSLAMVSKQFFANVGRVLESIDWTRRFPNKYIKGQINYDKPFCLLKRVPSSIRYDALIRTTPYRLVSQAFSGVTSLTIVGDMLERAHIYGVDRDYKLERDNLYDIDKCIFVTYPPVGSMPNLTKLVVVGRAFQWQRSSAETGGLYLLKYLIANTRCKLEHFECIEQLSLNYQPEFDISVFQCLFDNHESTLRLFKLKRTIKRNERYLTELNTIVETLKRYQLNLQFKLEFYDNNDNSDLWGNTEDSYKLVEEFEELELLHRVANHNDNSDDDADADYDSSYEDSYSDI
ncbi:hypothetical protein PPL_03422 [Heterostelium album PN500]|uniref:Uncharacterized protein n=1 Tax=Heterostelium pallidum (strain ATCC 26659 / Pp 5 / PN500) TaxID=670386 RepID=D3B4U6_HETP5|nr:hypothetical protein PPL_03422 [Heterostelium album PN500]EFA84344.1 hypothetical protein PPL_03422 [Heterostelium album PN500]|eukprot:XP_020436459.1 hypothetical protein PPL_03422 [Heterostelium album PN500]